jgi:hypothetical protein
MKNVIIFFILIINFAAVFSQNSIQSIGKITDSSENILWDLNESLWSHAHPSPGNGDKKKLLNFDAIDKWLSLPSLGDVSISHGGEYFTYGIQNNLHRRLDTLVIQSTTNSWRQALVAVSPGFFSSDGKQYIFQDKNRLCFLQTGSDRRSCYEDVMSYKYPANGKNEWLAYQLKNKEATLVLKNILTGKEKYFNDVSVYDFDISNEWLVCQLNNSNNELVIYHLRTGKEQHIDWVTAYSFNANGKALVVETLRKEISIISHSLQYINLAEDSLNEKVGKIKTIWSRSDSAESISSFSIDSSGIQVVFVTSTSLKVNNSIWYWKEGMEMSVMKVNQQTPGIDAGLYIQEVASFAHDSRYVQLALQHLSTDLNKPSPEAVVQVDLWSYQDSIVKSARIYPEQARSYFAILDPETGKVMRVEKEYEKIYLIKDDYVLVYKNGHEKHGDRFWEDGYYIDSMLLVSLKSGSRKFITKGQAVTFQNDFRISPDGRFLIYLDIEKGCNYFSYELATDKRVNISTGVPSLQLGRKQFNLRTLEKPIAGDGIVLWLKGSAGLLVYDNFDIWQLDPTGKKRPMNITNGYGRKHNIIFSLMDGGNLTSNGVPGGAFIGGDTLLLNAFNHKTKFNGFYRKSLGRAGDPELLSMDACYMKSVRSTGGVGGTMTPLKAANCNTWIVNRQTATEAPNYFITSDFRSYKPLTNLQPQKEYNWLTAELHSFKQLDGSISQGILYKPENFDSSKKYPVIISFYGELSSGLYLFPKPKYIDATEIYSNPAWMVSHGYLVFLPDINFIEGQWGPSTVNTVDGAANYLRQLTYVDGKHLGACGHSNSGRFGYYLLTHSHSFAAMSVGSGFCGADVLSGALSLGIGTGASNLETAEVNAFGTALGSIWQNKDKWIDHIAPLQADNATSPFLLFHNKKDGDDVRLAIELFIAFRRLEKKVWWLQYENGSHRVRGNDARDFTIRFTQFFDHYLKEAPAASWMTKGMRATKKGGGIGYNLDPTGNCSIKGKNECKVCNKWNKRSGKDLDN